MDWEAIEGLEPHAPALESLFRNRSPTGQGDELLFRNIALGHPRKPGRSMGGGREADGSHETLGIEIPDGFHGRHEPFSCEVFTSLCPWHSHGWVCFC